MNVIILAEQNVLLMVIGSLIIYKNNEFELYNTTWTRGLPSGELWDIKLASRGSLSLYSDKCLGPSAGGLRWEHFCRAFYFWLKNFKNKPIKLTRFNSHAPVSCLSVHILQVGLSLMSRHWSRLSFFILSFYLRFRFFLGKVHSTEGACDSWVIAYWI